MGEEDRSSKSSARVLHWMNERSGASMKLSIEAELIYNFAEATQIIANIEAIMNCGASA
jgi:hypothetical protein